MIASIETQLGGRASFDWRPDGLCCRLSVPVPETGERGAGMTEAKAGQDGGEAVALAAGSG